MINPALSFLFGLQIITIILFISNFWFGLKLDSNTSWISGMYLVILLVHSAKKKQLVCQDRSIPTKSNKIITGLLIFIILSSFLTSFWYPVTDWDAVTLFDFRARIIQNTGWIKDTLPRASILEYPLFTSLSHWLMYSVGFKTPMPLYPLLFGSFLLACYLLLRRNMSRTPALLAVLFLASAPKLFDQSLVAYSNMPYSIYLILGAAYLFYWVREHNKMDMIVGILLSILSLWVRSFPFFIVNILAALLVNRNTRKLGIFITLTGFISVVVYVWPVNINLFLKVMDFIKWGIIGYYKAYSILFLLILWLQLRQKKSFSFWLVLIIGYYISLILGTYLYALRDPNFASIPDTIQRTFMFINLAISWYAIDQIRNSD